MEIVYYSKTDGRMVYNSQQSRLMKFFANFLASYRLPILSGILLAESVPPVDIGFFALFAFVPLFIWIKKATLKEAFVGGLIAGTLYFGTLLAPLLTLRVWWWVGRETWMFEYRQLFLLLILGTVLIWSSVLFGIFTVLYKKWRGSILQELLLFPFLWITLELVRAETLSGFSWGHLGYALHNSANLAWIAQKASVYGLSLFVVVSNLLVFYTTTLFTETFEKNEKFSYLKSAGILCAAVVLVYCLTLPYQQDLRHLPHAIKIAVLHSALSTEKTLGAAGFENYEIEIKKALRENPNVLVLPENVFPFFILDRKTNLPKGYGSNESTIKTLFDRLLTLSRESPNTTFVIGMRSTDNFRDFNSLFLIKNASVTGRYDKKNLFPFAETTPKYFEKDRTDLIEHGAKNQPPLLLDGVPFLSLICSEIALIRKNNFDYPLIVSVGNDGIFESLLPAKENHIMAQVRAMENHSYLIRSAKGGISGVIDPKGRVLVSTNAEAIDNAILLFTISPK